MTFEFTVHPTFNFVKSFGEHFKIPVFKDRLKILASMGKGTIKMVDVADGIASSAILLLFIHPEERDIQIIR